MTPVPSPPSLSRSEWHVLHAVRSGCSSLAEICPRVPPPGLPSETVLALLKRLTVRGILSGDGQTWSVRPDLFQTLLRSQLEDLLETYVLPAPGGLETLRAILHERGPQPRNLG